MPLKKKAKNGKSDSTELPLTMKAGDTNTNSVVQTGCGE